MKIILNSLLIIILSVLLFISETDIPKKASKHVTNLSVNINGSIKIYGTAFYLKYKNETYIITNRHLCNTAVEYFIYNMLETKIDNAHINISNISKKTDLCAIKTNRKDGLEIAQKESNNHDKITIIGHPKGLPLSIAHGRVIGNYTARTYDNFYNDTIITNVTVFPGTSGSPVLNKHGKVVGVIFSKHYDTGYGVYINLKSLKTFLDSL